LAIILSVLLEKKGQIIQWPREKRTDNMMAKRKRTDNTMAKIKRTDNTMAKRKKDR
jgi:hypothetical protein